MPAHERRSADPDVDIRSARVEGEMKKIDDCRFLRQPTLFRDDDLGPGDSLRRGRDSRAGNIGHRFGVGLFLDLRRRDNPGNRDRHRRLFMNLRHGFHHGRRGIQRLAQTLGLLVIDHQLLEQEIDRRNFGHGGQSGHGSVVLIQGDPAGVVGGGENKLVMLGSHDRCGDGRR